MSDQSTLRPATGARLERHFVVAVLLATIATLALVATGSLAPRLMVAITAPLLAGVAVTAYAVVARRGV